MFDKILDFLRQGIGFWGLTVWQAGCIGLGVILIVLTVVIVLVKKSKAKKKRLAREKNATAPSAPPIVNEIPAFPQKQEEEIIEVNEIPEPVIAVKEIPEPVNEPVKEKEEPQPAPEREKPAAAVKKTAPRPAPKKETAKPAAKKKAAESVKAEPVKKESVAKSAVKGKYVIESNREGKYTFSLLANNGNRIFESEEYANELNCRNGIPTFKKYITQTDVETVPAGFGKFQYVIKRPNGSYTSKAYATEAAAKAAAVSVQRFCESDNVVVLQKH